jgi:hypothetical protein
MCPVECHVGHVFKNIVIRVSHDFDVVVPFRAFWAEVHEYVFRMSAVAGNRGFDLFVNNYKDLYTLFRLSLQDLI